MLTKFPYLQSQILFLNPCPAEKIKMSHPLLIFSQSDYTIQIVNTNFTNLMTNSVDPDQLASEKAK